MSDRKHEVTDSEPLETITDEQIVTERKLPRRSFLGTTGALLAGAVGIVSAVRASSAHTSPQDDPDKKPADPDKKPADPDKRRSDDPEKRRSDDPEKRRSEDPDKRKSEDPDKKKTVDPDKRPDPSK